ncbi:MAG: hypothetical protein RIQ72_441 [Candidatus Parcubacteria bacterium]|jgi:hypothetical protein
MSLWGIYPYATASAESVNVELLVAVCNANLICEDVIGENYGSCPSDCEAPPEPPAPPVVTPSIPGAPMGSSGYTNTTIFTNIPAIQNPQTPNNQNNSNNTNNGFPEGIQTKPDADLPKQGINGVISIAPDTNQVTVLFKTYLPSLLTISWGKTPTYEIGSSAEVSYRSNFATNIQNLEAGTVYYYRLALLDSIGRTIEYEGQFTTSNRFVKAPLPVATDFRARQGLQGTGIELTWNIESALTTLQQEYERTIQDTDPKNDMAEPNIYVRLVRSEFGFPKEPLEGKVIYEGRGERVSDFDVIDDENYFYSLFILNQKGQYSSPNVIRLRYKNIKDTLSSQQGGVGAKDASGTYYDPLIKDKDAVPLKDLLEAEERMGYCGIAANLRPVFDTISASDSIQKQEKNILIRFLQDRKELEIKNEVVIGHDGGALTLHVEGSLLKKAEYLPLCLVSNQTGKQNQYLLSQNQDGSYELILPAFFHKSGTKNDYQFTLGMIEYKGEEMVLLRGEIQFETSQNSSSRTFVRFSIFSLIVILVLRARKILSLLKLWNT